MITRTQQTVVALLFWIVFGAGAVLTISGQLIGIAVFAVTGNDGVREWVFRTGKAVDQLNNAAWFSGHHKETISSHAGRWYLDMSGRPIPYRFRFVKWLTDLFEKNHVINAVEEPFLNLPL